MNKQEEQVLKDLENKSQAWARIILRLINRLQKEIEQKQETIDKIMKELEEFYKKYDIISKDTIRNKIKELEEPDFAEYPIEKTIEVLKELLGETKDEE